MSAQSGLMIADRQSPLRAPAGHTRLAGAFRERTASLGSHGGERVIRTHRGICEQGPLRERIDRAEHRRVLNGTQKAAVVARMRRAAPGS